jgi:hypothetical protein
LVGWFFGGDDVEEFPKKKKRKLGWGGTLLT